MVCLLFNFNCPRSSAFTTDWVQRPGGDEVWPWSFCHVFAVPAVPAPRDSSRQSYGLGSQRLEDCALAVVATVVSTPAPDRAIADTGSKAVSADLRVPGLDGYGLVLGRRDLTVARLSEEQRRLDRPERDGLHIGDRLLIIPAHVCTTVNLHRRLVLVSVGGAFTWLKNDADGWQRPF